MPYISYTGPIEQDMFQKGTLTIVQIDIIFALHSLNRIKQPWWTDETKNELKFLISYDNEGKCHIFRIPSLLEKDMFKEGSITIVRIDMIFILRTLNRLTQPC